MIKLEKISRKQFCSDLEGKKVGMVGFRRKESFEKDLEVLKANQQWTFKAPSKYWIFHTTKSGNFRRFSTVNGDVSCFDWSKGDCAYKLGNFYIIITAVRAIYYKAI